MKVSLCAASAALLLLIGCAGSTEGGPNAQAPRITQHPQSAVVPLGQPVTFTVVAEGDAIRYQWFHNGDPIPGATASSYTIASVQETDSGQYYVILTNGAGGVRSNSATLTVATGAGDAEVTVQ